MKELNDALINVQSQLKAPKGQTNQFGKYKYRSAEDILESVKPLLAENGLSMVISDSVQEMGGMIVITSTATISDGKDSVSSSAQAGVDPNRKGMDIAQSFGSSGSYARKYAMNALLLIDDTKDADSQNDHKQKADFKPLPNASQIASMKAAVASGNSDAVTKALDSKYNASASMRKEILG
jgi:hypothetical protein